MAVPSGYEIALTITDPESLGLLGAGPHGFMVTNARQQDITPSSARRADGDTRFQLIPSESFWSQSDVAGGFGREYPPDPTMYFYADADTSLGSEIRSPWRWTGSYSPPAAAPVLAMCAYEGGLTLVAVNDGGTGQLWTFNPGGNVWVFQTNLASPAVTGLVAFRSHVWIAYGAANDVQKWDFSSLTTPAPAFKARVLCPYQSMLFYAYRDTSTGTWRLNRYDPENTAAVADLAIVTLGAGSSDYARSLVALGPDLFLVCADTLWKFTSQNGNAGVLAGPVDRWVPSGGAGGLAASGHGACAWQGAIYYSSGIGLRRHQPGGGGRQVWPVPPNGAPTSSQGDLSDIGWGLTPTQLIPVDDRLYLLGTNAIAIGASVAITYVYLMAWTGAGMHLLGQEVLDYTSLVTGGRTVGCATDNGLIVGGSTASASAMDSNSKVGFWIVRPTASLPRQYAQHLSFYTSWLDFGTVDLDKVLARVGVLCRLPDVDTWSVAVTVEVSDETTDPVSVESYALADVEGDGSESLPSFLYFSRSASPLFLVGKLFRFLVAVTGPAAPTDYARIFAITAIPNPAYPVRYGFRVEIPIGTHVRDLDGERPYANNSIAADYVALLRGMRAMGYPLTLDWLDGQSFTVRVNTIQIVREASRPGQYPLGDDAWKVVLDLQEISD